MAQLLPGYFLRIVEQRSRSSNLGQPLLSKLTAGIKLGLREELGKSKIISGDLEWFQARNSQRGK